MENKPPKTFFTVNEVNLPEGQRLVSQVSISWWGDDEDGYVVGYEFLIGDESENDWVFTTRTDSVFILPIEEGDMDADVRFSVRAVDNDGAVDPDPPYLVFPIRNSPPEIQFAMNETPPDTTYRVFSFGWNASDPDGDANLNRIEFSLNDTTQWHQVDVNIDFITVQVNENHTSAEVMLGRALRDSDIELDNLNINGDNTFRVRAVDNAAAVSEIAEYEWYIKEQTSNILFLNDYQGNSSQQRADLHLSLLAANGIAEVDYLDISDGTAQGGNRVLFSSAFHDRSLAQPTINKMLANWDHIYWISDNLDRNIGYAIEITLDFFDNGGTMFVNIPTKNVPSDNPIFSFLPFASMEPLPSGKQSFLIRNESEITANSEINNPPFLQIRRNIIGYYPLNPFGETVELFEAEYYTRAQITGDQERYEGSNLISAVSPGNDLLYFGVDFNEFTEASELERLIEILCIETLGFQQ